MDRFAGADRPLVPPVRLRRRPGRRARRRPHGLGCGRPTRRSTYLTAKGEKVGVLKVRLYRPFVRLALPRGAAARPSSRSRSSTAPRSPARRRAALQGRDLRLAEAVANGTIDGMPRIIGGRYGLSSKEFTPAMVKAVFDELAKDAPKNGFTVGIKDDVTAASLEVDPTFTTEPDDVVRACSTGWAPTARSAPTRTRSRSSARRRTTTRRATSSTTRRRPVPSPSATCVSGRARSARPTWSAGQLRRLPPARSSSRSTTC
jgi:hypothetical protein